MDIPDWDQRWHDPGELIKALKERTTILTGRTINAEAEMAFIKSSYYEIKPQVDELEKVVNKLTLYNCILSFYFQELYTKEEVRRLFMMLESPDEADKELARTMLLQKIK